MLRYLIDTSTEPSIPSSMSSDYAIPAPPVISLPVRGSHRRFPVHRIYCVGRNYAAHAIEMGHDPHREPPFFFQKNPDTLLANGSDFPYPDKSADVHYELELVVALASVICRGRQKRWAVPGMWARPSIIQRRARRSCRWK
jgi:fumarylpyruvate hydrolase